MMSKSYKLEGGDEAGIGMKVNAIDQVVYCNQVGESYLLMVGGGGAGKHGVANAIQICQVENGDTVYYGCLASVCTDLKDCHPDKKYDPKRLYLGLINDTQVLCVTFRNANVCSLYRVNGAFVGGEGGARKNDAPAPDLTQLLTFIRQFDNVGGGKEITSLCMSPEGLVILGDSSGRCNVWSFEGSTFDNKIVASVDCFGGKGIVTSINHHFIESVIAVTSDAGICKLFNVAKISSSTNSKEVKSNGLICEENSTRNSSGNVIPFQSCCFSSDASRLYILQSTDKPFIAEPHKKIFFPPPGHNDCNLLVYDVKMSKSGSDNDIRCVLLIKKTICVSNTFPGKILAMSDDGYFVAVGTMFRHRGDVKSCAMIYNTETFKKSDDFIVGPSAVSCLSFAHSSTVAAHQEDIDAILYACALKVLKCKKVYVGYSVMDKICVTIALLILIAILFIFTMVIIGDRELAGQFLDSDED